MKKCPYCAEEIQDEAIKCKYCKSDLIYKNNADIFGKRFPQRKVGKSLIWIFLGLVLLITIVIGAFYCSKKSSETKQIISNSSDITTSELSSQEINEISKSLVLLFCFSKERTIENPTGALFGSGTLFDKNIFEEKHFDERNFSYEHTNILTNGHVAELKEISSNDINLNNCVVSFSGKEALGTYSYNQSGHFLDGRFDVALLEYAAQIGGKKQEGRPSISDEEIKKRMLKNYPICSKDKMIGSKVYVFGYPASALKIDTYKEEHNLIITSGIISGVDGNGNYYTDAKIDSGNSGGLAVSKIDNKICLAGIPTWVSRGNFENLGLIQPLEDIAKLFKEDFEGQLYKNEEYGFNIKFPADWPIVDESDESSFVKKAKRDLMNFVYVRIGYHLGMPDIDENFFGADKNNTSSLDLNDPLNKNAKIFIDGMVADFSEKNPNIPVIEKGITFINNKRAVYFKVSSSVRKQDNTMGGLGQSFYYAINRGKLYTIGGNYEKGDSTNYDKSIVDKSIATFFFN
jgi:hypothetical protein